jgi:hypothetical protein
MTPPNKPEWIELADADSAPQTKKVTRALPAFVLAAALSIVGVGALVAQSGAETPTTATEQGVKASTASSPAEPSATSAITNPNAPKQPGIASMPTGGEDEGEDDDDEDDDNDEEDDDEGDDD